MVAISCPIVFKSNVRGACCGDVHFLRSSVFKGFSFPSLSLAINSAHTSRGIPLIALTTSNCPLSSHFKDPYASVINYNCKVCLRSPILRRKSHKLSDSLQEKSIWRKDVSWISIYFSTKTCNIFATALRLSKHALKLFEPVIQSAANRNKLSIMFTLRDQHVRRANRFPSAYQPILWLQLLFSSFWKLSRRTPSPRPCIAAIAFSRRWKDGKVINSYILCNLPSAILGFPAQASMSYLTLHKAACTAALSSYCRTSLPAYM